MIIRFSAFLGLFIGLQSNITAQSFYEYYEKKNTAYSVISDDGFNLKTEAKVLQLSHGDNEPASDFYRIQDFVALPDGKILITGGYWWKKEEEENGSYRPYIDLYDADGEKLGNVVYTTANGGNFFKCNYANEAFFFMNYQNIYKIKISTGDGSRLKTEALGNFSIKESCCYFQNMITDPYSNKTAAIYTFNATNDLGKDSVAVAIRDENLKGIKTFRKFQDANYPNGTSKILYLGGGHAHKFDRPVYTAFSEAGQMGFFIFEEGDVALSSFPERTVSQTRYVIVRVDLKNDYVDYFSIDGYFFNHKDPYDVNFIKPMFTPTIRKNDYNNVCYKIIGADYNGFNLRVYFKGVDYIDSEYKWNEVFICYEVNPTDENPINKVTKRLRTYDDLGKGMSKMELMTRGKMFSDGTQALKTWDRMSYAPNNRVTVFIPDSHYWLAHLIHEQGYSTLEQDENKLQRGCYPSPEFIKNILLDGDTPFATENSHLPDKNNAKVGLKYFSTGDRPFTLAVDQYYDKVILRYIYD